MELQRIKEAVFKDFYENFRLYKIKDVTVERSLDFRTKNSDGWKFILFDVTIKDQIKTINLMYNLESAGFYKIYMDDILIGNYNNTNNIEDILKTVFRLLVHLL